jgi:hypothetical protein
MSIANIILNGENLKPFSLNQKQKKLSTLIQYSARISSQSSKARDRNKRETNRKGRSQITIIFR